MITGKKAISVLMSYNECVKRYGSDFLMKKAIHSGELFRQQKGIYSEREQVSELELIVHKYPRAVFAGESAYYYYGLTDDIPDQYYLATRRTDSRIKQKSVHQLFVQDEFFDLEVTEIMVRGIPIPIYSRERLLVDLIRMKSRIPFDYYKEVIGNYRRIVSELDFFKVEDYALVYKSGSNIMEAIQLEVL